jgi:hypothetical protein
MRRPAVITVTLSTLTALASGCATYANKFPASCQFEGDRQCDASDAIGEAIALGAGVLIVGAYLTAKRLSSSKPAAVAPMDPRLSGHVRWQGQSAQGVPSVRVTLRRADGPPLQTTNTDQAGRFYFDFPRGPGWYTVAVDAATAVGETNLWLQDRLPSGLEVLVRPRAALPGLMLRPR